MAIVGGDITEIQYNHPTEGSGTLFVKADEDSTFDLGGIRNSDDDSMIFGNGQAGWVKTRVRWSWEGTTGWDMNGANELEALIRIAASPVDAQFTISHINGTVWSAEGNAVGDLKGNSKEASIALKLAGGNIFEKTSG